MEHYTSKFGKNLVIIESEEKLKLFLKVSKYPICAETIDILLIPKSLKKTFNKKFPEFWAAIIPTINYYGGKIIYFEE